LGDSESNWIILKKEPGYSIKVEEPKTGSPKRKTGGSVAILGNDLPPTRLLNWKGRKNSQLWTEPVRKQNHVRLWGFGLRVESNP
jgi:hypothetical protein